LENDIKTEHALVRVVLTEWHNTTDL